MSPDFQRFIAVQNLICVHIVAVRVVCWPCTVQGWMCVADSCPDNLLTLNMTEKKSIHLNDRIEVVNRKGCERLTILSIVAMTRNKNEENQGAKIVLNLRPDGRIRLGRSLKRLRRGRNRSIKAQLVT